MSANVIKEKALVLRTCSADGTSRNGFKWPTRGRVSAPDWEPSEGCGRGLHGALWGEGDGYLFRWEEDALWQVVEVHEYIELGGKVKFPSGVVLFTGTQRGATDYLQQRTENKAIIGATVKAGDGGTAEAGDSGTAKAGHHGTAKAGHLGTAKAGDGGTAEAGYLGTAKAGHLGTAKAGDGGTISIKSRDGVYVTAKVGEDVRPNTWYKLVNNQLEEVK